MKKKPKLPTQQVTLEFCKGSIGGEAIYLNHGSGGYRVAGPKCYGLITPIRYFRMSCDDLERLIDEATKLVAKLKNESCEGTTA